VKDQLAELAERLDMCRKRWNERTLEYVLESAQILGQAKAIAKRDFGVWLRTHARMDSSTAENHLRVARLVQRFPELIPKIASLNVSKAYVLAALDYDSAKRVLSGEVRFTRPLNDLNDVQFKTEIREKFPPPPKRRTRVHAYRSVMSTLHRAETELHRAGRFARRMTPAQRRKVFDKIAAISRLSTMWADVVYRATKS